MAEMVHRILPARALGLKHPLLFVSTSQNNLYPYYDTFPGFVKEILEFLNVRGQDVRVISANTVVDRLHIVEAGSDLVGGPKPGYLDLLSEFSLGRLDGLYGEIARPKKLYVSRSALVPQGIILGESYFEQCLEREGFTVFRPEEIRFTAQMDHYHKAEVVIFPEGSACHGTELLGAGMLGQSFIMPRRKGQMTGFQRIIEPRSTSFQAMDGCVEFLGTASANPRTGTALTHIGTSWINVPTMVSFCRANNIAALQGFCEVEYARAATEDFDRYIAFQSRPGAPWHDGYATELKAAFAAKLASLG